MDGNGLTVPRKQHPCSQHFCPGKRIWSVLFTVLSARGHQPAAAPDPRALRPRPCALGPGQAQSQLPAGRWRVPHHAASRRRHASPKSVLVLVCRDLRPRLSWREASLHVAQSLSFGWHFCASCWPCSRVQDSPARHGAGGLWGALSSRRCAAPGMGASECVWEMREGRTEDPGVSPPAGGCAADTRTVRSWERGTTHFVSSSLPWLRERRRTVACGDRRGIHASSGPTHMTLACPGTGRQGSLLHVVGDNSAQTPSVSTGALCRGWGDVFYPLAWKSQPQAWVVVGGGAGWAAHS